MRSQILICSSLLTAMLGALGAPQAQADTPFAMADITSNFVWRGVTQSNNNPALQGEVGDQASSGVYGSIWASTMDRGDARLRADLRGGFRTEFSTGVKLDAALVVHRFDAPAFNFNESLLRVGIAGISGRWSRDWVHGNDYFAVRDKFGLGSGYQFLLHAGHTSGDTVHSYDDIAAGVGKVINDWHLALLATDTDHATPGGGAHLILKVSRRW
ncbi:MAG TPA: TorF family putative porin [Acidiferrobacteraceae bacterium]|nr:TorF family putative porin [Acidiferrobacteraceae bacterium]